MLSIFSCVCLPSVFLLWRNVCLVLWPIFSIGSFIFLVLSCMSCLCIFETNSLPVALLAIIFSHSEGCLFTRFVFSKDTCALCWVAQSCLTLCDPMDCSLPGSSVHRDSPGKNNGVGCPSSRGIFQTQRSNLGLPHCRQIIYHQGATREVQEYWGGVAYPFPRGSSWPRNRTGVSCIAGEFFTSWVTREALYTLIKV